MAGIPAYPADWASELSSIRQQLNATAASAQTRVGYTGGSLPGALSVGQALTAAGGLGVTGAATVSGAVTAGSVAATGAVSAGSATVTGAVSAADLVGNTLTLNGNVIPLADLLLVLDPPGATLVKGAAQGIGTGGGDTLVTGLAYTAPSAGYYAVAGAIRWDNNATGRRQTNIVINGATYQCDSRHSSSSTLLVQPFGHVRAALAAGQTVQPSVWQNTGAGLDVLADSWMSVRWVGPL